MGSIQSKVQEPSRRKALAEVLEIPDIPLSSLELGENIGWGATGVVRKSIIEDTPVAVKVFFPETRRDLFTKELRAWSRASHPNVVTVYGASTEEGSLGMVMELMEHGSLYDFIHKTSENTPEQWPLLYRISIDVCAAMCFLHQHDMAHRDLKSGNVLLATLDAYSDEPVAKLCDFGNARRLSARANTPKVGTLPYMAPELFTGDSYSSKVDVYAYGVLLWEMVARQEPHYERTSPLDVIEQVKGGVRPIIPSDCPPMMAELISACWAEDPNCRPTFDMVMRRLLGIGQLWDELQLDHLLQDSISSDEELEGITSGADSPDPFYFASDLEAEEAEEAEETDPRRVRRVSDGDALVPGVDKSWRAQPKPKPYAGHSASLGQVERHGSPTAVSTSIAIKRTKRHHHGRRHGRQESHGSVDRRSHKPSGRKVSTAGSAPATSADPSFTLSRSPSPSPSPLYSPSTSPRDDVASDMAPSVAWGQRNEDRRKVLRVLSQKKSNLQTLLYESDLSGLEEGDFREEFVVQMLQAALRKQSLSVRKLRSTVDLYKGQILKEKKKRMRLERDLLAQKLEEIHPSSKPDTADQASTHFGRVKDIRRSRRSIEKLRTRISRSMGPAGHVEIDFEELQFEPRPMQQNAYGVWYGGTWHDMPVLVCMILRGISSAHLQEFQSLAGSVQRATNYPALASLLGIASRSPNFALVFEARASERTLLDVIKTGPRLSPEVCMTLALQIARTCAYLHRLGIAFGDLKPSIVLLDDRLEQCRCLHLLHVYRFLHHVVDPSNKFRWSSPETVANVCECSAAADVFSFGLLLWSMCTGAVPFADVPTLEIPALMKAHKWCHLRPPNPPLLFRLAPLPDRFAPAPPERKLTRPCRPEIPEDMPQQLQAVVQRCLRVTPSHRPSMEAVVQMLRGEAVEDAVASVPQRVASEEEPMERTSVPGAKKKRRGRGLSVGERGEGSPKGSSSRKKSKSQRGSRRPSELLSEAHAICAEELEAAQPEMRSKTPRAGHRLSFSH